jgi:N6-adenosine-specific RNA methylase IME4
MRSIYDVILADPPWSYYGAPDKWAAAGKHYRLMPDPEVLAMPIRDVLAPRGILFLWATSPRLDFAVNCLNSWGLHFRGVAFVWVKTTAKGVPIGAQGIRASITKPTTEFVLAGSRIAKGRPMPLADEGVAQTVLAPRHREHSRKPDEVAERIERMYPDARRLEMFARRQRANWDCCGDEVQPRN